MSAMTLVQRRFALCVMYAGLLLLPIQAYASSKKVNYLPWAAVGTLIAIALSWWLVKRTRMMDNVHLKIIGFSVYFWIVLFAEVLVYGLYRYVTD